MSEKLVSNNLRSIPSLYTQAQRFSTTTPRYFSPTCPRKQSAGSQLGESKSENEKEKEKEQGALSRKLSEMTEDAMLEGGRAARKNMQEAGFSDDLKKQLEERIAASSFRSDNAVAHSLVDMPVWILPRLRNGC